MKANVAEAKRGPRDQAGHGTQVLQPGKSLRWSATTKTEVSKRTKEPGGDDCDVGYTVAPRLAKELRQLVVRRHGKDHTTADPAVRVTCRPSRNKNAGVDDAW